MSWANVGYDDIDNAIASYEDDGGDSNVREFWTPIGGTKRIVVLDDAPYGFWSHSLWSFGVKGAQAICLDRNGNLSQTHGKCPLCELNQLHRATKGAQGAKAWPIYVAYITVIDCGEVKNGATGQYLEGWVNDKGVEFNFDRKVLPLKKGGKDKPGLLHKFRRFKEKKGGTLVGAVFDLYRAGQKEERPGTEWEFKGFVDVSSVETLKATLLSMEGVRPDVHAKLINENITSNGAHDYMSHFSPRNRGQILALINSKAGGSSYNSTPPSAFGAGKPSKPATAVADYGDEDIPF